MLKGSWMCVSSFAISVSLGTASQGVARRAKSCRSQRNMVGPRVAQAGRQKETGYAERTRLKRGWEMLVVVGESKRPEVTGVS